MLIVIWRAFIFVVGIALSLPIGQVGYSLHAAPAEQSAPTEQSAPAAQSVPSEQSVPVDQSTTEPSTEPDQAAAQEQIEALEDKAVVQFATALEAWRKQLKTIEETVVNKAAPDEQLREIPSLLESLRREITDQKSLLRAKLEEARDRWDKLGPAPGETGPKESPETAAQRERLGAEFAAIDGLMKQADVLVVRADQLTDAANAERRERFTESLFRPVPSFYSYVLAAAVKRLPSQMKSVLDAIGQRLGIVAAKGHLLLILLFLAPIAGAVGARRFLNRIRSRRASRQAEGETVELTLQQRGTIAMVQALESCVPVWAGLAAFYLIATAAEFGTPSGEGVLVQAGLSIAWASLLASVVHQSLMPADASRRLISVDDAVAWRLTLLLWCIIAVWLLDHIWNLADSIVFTPYQMAVLRSTVVAALYSLLLIPLLLPIESRSFMPRASGRWPGWLFWSIAVLAGFLLMALLLGYPELARFVGSHLVSTVGVLWIMYLLHLATELISSVSVLSGRHIEDEATPEDELDAPSLFTIRIIGGLLMDIAIVIVGVTILLLLWRFDWVEVKGWIQAAFFGVQLGDMRVSLQSVLFALGVFAVGLLVTRFVQRWFVSRAFAGRHRDSGLQESARIGLGYLGFVLSALAGLSYLGLDFSNLAIVAGALSVGIGFGLQSIFNNFVSGIILLVERPIKIGDWIAVGGHEGMVKRISVRSTEIETIYRQSVIIPNANLITDTVTNWMHGDKSCRVDIPVGVSYGTDVRVLRTTLLGVAASHGAVLKHPVPVVHFAGFGDSALDFELRVFLRDARQRISVSSELRYAIWSALNSAAITIPFPQRDVHIKHEDASDEGGSEPSPQRHTEKTSGRD